MDRETRIEKLIELQNKIFDTMCAFENDGLEQEAEQLRDLFNELQGMDFERTGQEEFDDLLERFENPN